MKKAEVLRNALKEAAEVMSNIKLPEEKTQSKKEVDPSTISEIQEMLQLLKKKLNKKTKIISKLETTNKQLELNLKEKTDKLNESTNLVESLQKAQKEIKETPVLDRSDSSSDKLKLIDQNLINSFHSLENLKIKISRVEKSEREVKPNDLENILRCKNEKIVLLEGKSFFFFFFSFFFFFLNFNKKNFKKKF